MLFGWVPQVRIFGPGIHLVDTFYDYPETISLESRGASVPGLKSKTWGTQG